MKFEPKLFDAVYALVGGGISASDDVTKVEDFIFSDGQTPPTQEEAENKFAELKADYDAKQYQRDRKLEYPSIQELVVALYDEEDKASIIERRNAVKAKYPKPE